MALKKVASATELQGCFRKENAWKIITDYSRYPQFMDNVQKVEITERSSDEGVSRWFLSVDSAPLTWVEKDYFDKPRFEVMFKSIEGDFDNINGLWQIKDRGDSGINILFEIEYNLGIPVIEEILGPILHGKMKANVDKMMSAIGKELRCASADERRHARYVVKRHHACTFNSEPHGLFVLDVSAGGMMTRRVPACDGRGALEIVSLPLDIASVYTDEAQNHSRFIFSKPLDIDRLTALVEHLTTTSSRLHAPAAAPYEATVFCNDKEVPVSVVDLSPAGMKFSYEGAAVPGFESFAIGSTPISLKEIVHDDKRNLVSIRFASALSDEQYRLMRDHFGITKEA